MSHLSLNRCNLPPWVIASRHFADDPHPLELQGVRASNRFLFETLDAEPDPARRGERFHDWLSVRFQLHHWQEQETPLARKSLRNSYLRFLRGWGVDSSSLEGAVLKGWVESRLGIPPTYHHAAIRGLDGEAYERYARDRMAGSARTSAIYDQLDLVYTFSQYELARQLPGVRWLTLYRGQHAAGDHEVLETVGPREQVVRLNSICSFTDDRERAWEFGNTVWEARVAVPRIFCASWLLRSVLRGEREVLVVGAEMRVRRLLS
jgi:NAD+--dinitrogen-reductase ADP-D-ribosyltransferase